MELYIHIPFCVRKCHYCSFVSYPDCTVQEMEEYLSDLLRETEIRKTEIKESIDTVYIGGGTPSLIPSDVFAVFLKRLEKIIDLSAVKEFSVEANPGTVTAEWLRSISSFGINRLSIGMQARQNSLLRTLGRIHDAEDVRVSVETARECGFRNINLDLIFGIPGQTLSDWDETLEYALSLNPEHISAYGLIPEEGTVLWHQLESGLLSLPEPDNEREMYDHAISVLNDAGLLQYEISNFARPGYACVHNIGYWDQTPYIGIGLSAASMCLLTSSGDGAFSIRRTNPGTFHAYRKMLNSPEKFHLDKELIGPAEARFETVMLALRMNRGIDEERFVRLHGKKPDEFYGETLTRLEQQGLIYRRDHCWRLTRRGMDIQNSVLLEFMDDEKR